MANKEPTTVIRKIDGKVTNSLDITWPHDDTGFTTLLRKEGVRAIGRIKGDKARLEVLIQTLKVLGEHARVKQDYQVKDAARQEAAAENVRQATYARSLADQEAEVKRLERVLESARAAVEAKKAVEGTDAS